MIKKDKQAPRHQQYIDPTGQVTNKDLARAEWFIAHKLGILHFLKIMGSVIAILLFVYGVGGWLWYLVFGWNADKQNAAELVKVQTNYTALQESYGAKPLAVADAGFYNSAPGKYDFAVTVKNENVRYFGIVTYKFVTDVGETSSTQAYVLPQSERPLVVLGWGSSLSPMSAQFVLESIVWKQINPHALFDIAGYMSDRMKFGIDKFQFTPQSNGGNNPTNSIAFSYTNASAFGYWELPLIVELMNGESRVGVAQTVLNSFRPGDIRPIDLRTLAEGQQVSGVRVTPNVNIFDSKLFMAPQG